MQPVKSLFLTTMVVVVGRLHSGSRSVGSLSGGGGVVECLPLGKGPKGCALSLLLTLPTPRLEGLTLRLPGPRAPASQQLKGLGKNAEKQNLGNKTAGEEERKSPTFPGPDTQSTKLTKLRTAESPEAGRGGQRDTQPMAILH
ncbi:hypothetical protein E2C01_013776 [Portunus trituberculatus]|uniref:Uncharacterized protein n=1 Tax=Portunus trituberculatus TaxID=210409 RepID=A0A5B7DIC8_PORTR|nr:hypothetical protein [Portunus trituberculatus]